MTDTEKQNNGKAGSAGKDPGFKSLFCHLLTVGAWVSYFTSLCLSFFICKRRIITSHRIWVKGVSQHIKHLKKLPCPGTVLSGAIISSRSALPMKPRSLLWSPRCPLCISLIKKQTNKKKTVCLLLLQSTKNSEAGVRAGLWPSALKASRDSKQSMYKINNLNKQINSTLHFELINVISVIHPFGFIKYSIKGVKQLP